MNVNLDDIESACNQVKDNTQFVNSRLNNIQNKLAENTDGSGDTAGELLKAMNVNLNDIESASNQVKDNTEFVNSRLNNIQNKLSENTDGSGDTAGELLKAIETEIVQHSNKVFTVCGTQANLMNGVSCVAAGTTSSVVDWFNSDKVPKRVSIIVTATASVATTGVEVYGSADGTTYGRLTTFTPTTTNVASATINTTGGVVVDWSLRYIKIVIYSLGTYTATAIGLA